MTRQLQTLLCPYNPQPVSLVTRLLAPYPAHLQVNHLHLHPATVCDLYIKLPHFLLSLCMTRTIVYPVHHYEAD